jgi:RNA polymerase sigma factor (sigma-70 family)
VGARPRAVLPGTPEQWARVEDHRGLVDYFANLYHRRSSHVLEFEDLRAVGRIGALEALQQHDPGMEPHQWRRFLALKIKRRIQYHVESQAAPIRLPPKSMRDYVRRTRPRSSALAAVDRLIDHPPTSRVDQVADPCPSGADPVEVADVRDALATLPPLEREAIEAHYGIGQNPRRDVQIAADLGLTRQAISRRRVRGLARLRHKFQSSS